MQNDIQLCTAADVKAISSMGDLLKDEKITPSIIISWPEVRSELGAGLLRAFQNALFPPLDVTAITAANPGVATTSRAHGFVTGDEVAIHHPHGMQVKGVYSALVLSPTTFSLRDPDTLADIDTTYYGTYRAGSAVTFKMSPIRYSVLDYSVSMQAYMAYRHAIMSIAYQKENAGVVQVEGGAFRAASKSTINELLGVAQAGARRWAEEIKRIICDNPSEFPEVKQADDLRDLNANKLPPMSFI